jgi:2,4-dienoyl-CoA reductase-like NADH-dependent reductase (Old Yellow Enzyme family)
LKLFTPFTLKGMALKNRVIKSATLENMARWKGCPLTRPGCSMSAWLREAQV